MEEVEEEEASPGGAVVDNATRRDVTFATKTTKAS